jgi:chemotaxis protein CheD
MTAAETAAPDRIFLLPGMCHCALAPAVLTTVLGSCVSICLWDGVNRIGGMNHYILPASLDGERSTRFGDTAIEHLVQGMLELGSNLPDLRAKVFGGAAVLAVADGAKSVGEQNVAAAFEHLEQHRIPIAIHRTGGRLGRLIRLYTQTGEVDLQPVGMAVNSRPGRRR